MDSALNSETLIEVRRAGFFLKDEEVKSCL